VKEEVTIESVRGFGYKLIVKHQGGGSVLFYIKDET